LQNSDRIDIRDLYMINKLLRKIVLLTSALLIASSSVITLSETAFAEPGANGNSNTTNADQLMSYLYYVAMGNCIKNSDYEGGASRDYIEPSKVSTGEWFYNGTTFGAYKTNTNVSYLVNSSDGTMSCGDPNFVNGALAAWSKTGGSKLDPGYALTQLGFKVESNGNYTPIRDDTTRVNTYKMKASTIGAVEAMTPAMRYLLYSQSFIIGCGAKKVAIEANASSAEKEIPNTQKGYLMLDVDESSTPAKTVQTIYQTQRDKTDVINYATNSSFNGNERTTCAGLTNKASAVAAAYAAVADGSLAAIAGKTGSTTGEESCAIQGIGWIVCPVLTFTAKLADSIASIYESLLVFHLENPLDTSSPLYQIWSNIRNLANTAFIFVFLMIVFSQSTGFGISNYGIKKLLPRIIVGAILVNLSYYICIFALDVSNILGAGIDGLVRAPIRGIVPPNSTERVLGSWVAVIVSGGAVGAGAAIISAGGIAAAGSAAWSALLGIGATLIPMALLGATLMLISIIAYKALWVTLIALSPILAITSILPGTQGIYKKGMGFAKGLFMFYPLVMFAFAITYVGSVILRSAAQ
jgi:hypothetical protein